jgi:hypothetical protein
MTDTEVYIVKAITNGVVSSDNGDKGTGIIIFERLS